MAAMQKMFFTPILAALIVATTLASAGPAMAGLSARVDAAPVSDVGAMTTGSSQAVATAEPQSIEQGEAKEGAQRREALVKRPRRAEHVAPRESRPAPRSLARPGLTRVSMVPTAPCHRWR
jgi:hypothetical protein